MRILTIILISFITTISLFGQGLLELRGGKVFYQDIEEVDLSGLQIYAKSKTWTATNFYKYGIVLELDNKDDLTILGIGVIEAINKLDDSKKDESQIKKDVQFSFQVEAKDNRYRVTITNVMIEFNNSNIPIEEFMQSPVWNESSRSVSLYQDVHQQFSKLLNDLKNHLTLKDDW